MHEQLRDVPDSALAFPPPSLEDVASYFCTGGTTGMPKIAIRTHHRTEVANASQVAAMFGNGGLPGPLFCGLPLFHLNAQMLPTIFLNRWTDCEGRPSLGSRACKWTIEHPASIAPTAASSISFAVIGRCGDIDGV